MANNVAVWNGYEFHVFPASGTTWNDTAGIYIFAGISQSNTWIPLYIGQTNSFSTRFSNHERWSEASRKGATHVHAMVVNSQSDRDKIESRLIHSLNPQMNDQLKR